MSTTNLGLVEISESQNLKEITANTAFEGIDTALCALSAIAMTDADITLTQAQLASGIVLSFSGTLTANRHVNLPASIARFVFITNATTGGYSLIVQVTGAPGSTVTTTGTLGIFSDGTNVTTLASATTPFAAAGDLSGSASTQTVVGIQGKAVSATAPAAGQVLEWNGSAYVPTNLSSAFDPLDPSSLYWREEWNTASTNPANTSPFGLWNWDEHNWTAGTAGSSIQQGGWDAQHERYMHLVTDGSSGHGCRVYQRLQQGLAIAIAWTSRIIFRLGGTTNIRALAGFGHDDSGSPLTWFLGVRFDTTLGSPDTDFMFGAGASDGSSGAYSSSTVAADTNAHDLVIAYPGSGNSVTFTMDGGTPVVVNIGGAIDGGVGLYPGLWIYGASAAIESIDCNFFAFKYTGLTR